MKQKLKGLDLLNFVSLNFLIGSIFGTYYEQIITLVEHLIKDGKITWVSRSGLIYGPLSPVYGLGTILVLFLFCLPGKNYNKFKVFIYATFFGGAFEYLVSFFQEKIFGSVSWDYSNFFLNIGGRTTVIYMIFWGLSVMLYIYYLYPLLIKFYFKVKGKIANIIFISIFLILIFDITISAIAIYRQNMRHKKIEAKTFIGRFCDEYYTDEYLKKIYDNLIFVD